MVKKFLLFMILACAMASPAFAQYCGTLKQASAGEAKLGPLVDSADATPETGLTILDDNIILFKIDVDTGVAGDPAQKHESTTAVHESGGTYRWLYDATDTNTLGILKVQVELSGVAPYTCYYDVVADASINVNFLGNISDVTDILAALATAQADLDNIQTRISTLTVPFGTSDSGSTTTMVDSARSEADTDYWKGDFIVFTSGNIAGQTRLITGFNAATDTITFTPAATQAVATQTYEIIPAARVDIAAWLGTVVATPATAGIPDINVKNIDNDAASASGTVTFPNATLASTTNITAGTITTATNVTTVNGIGAGVITATSIATDAITAAKLAADAGTEIGTAVWATTTRQLTGTQAFNLTGNITGDITGNMSGSVGSVSGAVGSVAGSVGGNVNGSVASVAGSIGSLAAQAKADVNAEVVDAFATDTYAEPGQGTPGSTASLASKIGYLYKAWRNRITQTSSSYSLYASDGTTIDQKATVTDDTVTTVRGAIVAGP